MIRFSTLFFIVVIFAGCGIPDYAERPPCVDPVGYAGEQLKPEEEAIFKNVKGDTRDALIKAINSNQVHWPGACRYTDDDVTRIRPGSTNILFWFTTRYVSAVGRTTSIHFNAKSGHTYALHVRKRFMQWIYDCSIVDETTGDVVAQKKDC